VVACANGGGLVVPEAMLFLVEFRLRYMSS